MQQCPRCGSGVPDGRDTCHICKGPLNPAAAAQKPAQAAEPAAPQQSIGLAAQTPVGLAAPGPLAGGPLGAAPAEPEEAPELVAGIPGLDNLPKQDNPYAAPSASPMGGPQMRTTLAGDVIEVNEPEAAPFPGAGNAPKAFPGTGAPLPPARPTGPTTMGRGRGAGGPVMASESRSGGGAGAVIGIVIVLLLIIGGGAGWWWWQKQHAPVAAVQSYFTAYKAKDWKAVYAATDLPAELKSQVTEDKFAKLMDMMGKFITITDMKAGECTIQGDEATVKVSVTVEAGGQTKTVEADQHMKLVDGQWKMSQKLPGAAVKPSGVPGM